jgi:hypothetical protein
MVPDDYTRMVAEQRGCCAICGASCTLHIDHCHAGGQVRALLCYSCNTGLGAFRDDPGRMRRAAEYIERHA